MSQQGRKIKSRSSSNHKAVEFQSQRTIRSFFSASSFDDENITKQKSVKSSNGMCENQQENLGATRDRRGETDNKRGRYDACDISARTEAHDEINQKPADGCRTETEIGSSACLNDNRDVSTSYDQGGDVALFTVSDEYLTSPQSRCQSTLCCKDALSPFQPVSDIILSKTERSFSASSTRRLKASWFELYPWLHLCTTNYKAYCFICIQAAHHHVSCKADQAFISIGFNNWKKALEKFNYHQMSSAHRAVVGDKMARESGISVYNQIFTQYESQQQQHLASFMNELKSLVFLLRQALPIRGHDDDEGNLHQCLKICFSEHKWTEDARYLSPEIVNEIIQIMAHSILRSVLEDIRQAKWFAIMADETRDISNREQLVICIRWVTQQYEVLEEPVGLLQLDNSSAVTIFSALKDCLIRLNLPVEKCRGQAYDGASTFQGHISGVAKRFRDEVPSAISVHCLAHSVNLVLQETARKIKIIRDALDFALEIIQLITLSPKRQVLFETIQKEAGGSSPTIKPLCPTRWTVRTRAMESLIKNYEILQETLEVVSEGSDEYARRASGLLALMQQFSTFLGLSLARTVFAVTEELSTALQKQSTSCEDASSAASVCINTLQKMRSDEYFLDFFNDVKAKASRLCDAPRLPRQRQVPRRIDDGSEGHWYADIAAYYRQQYFETLDHIVENIQRRFHQDSFNVPRQIEKLLCEAVLGKSTEIPRNIASTYSSDIDFTRLKTQLSFLPSAITVSPDKTTVQSIIRAISSELVASETVRKMLSEIDKLLKLYLTIPVTTATAERSFSALKRTKTYLRSSMTQTRLNNCLIMHVFKERVDLLNLDEIAMEFIDRNHRRRSFFGTLTCKP